MPQPNLAPYLPFPLPPRGPFLYLLTYVERGDITGEKESVGEREGGVRMTVGRGEKRGGERETVAWHTAASGHCVAASSDPLFV